MAANWRKKMSQNSETGTRPLTHNMHFEITLAQGELSPIRKTHSLAQGLRKDKFRWNQVSSWQHSFKRNLLFNLYGDGKKIWHLSFVSSCRLRERENIWHLQPISCLETPRLPACYPLKMNVSVSYNPESWLTYIASLVLLYLGESRKKCVPTCGVYVY